MRHSLKLSLVFLILSTSNSYSQTQKISDTAFPPALIEWVKNNARPIASVDPAKFEDELAFMDAVIGNKKLVLLGEGTHGTKEIFQIKDKIARYLIQNKRFSKLGIEYDLIKGYRVNEYIHEQNDDLYGALNEQRGWVWNTEEIADMIKWLRSTNAKGIPVDYYGIDMFKLLASAQEACGFLAKNDIQEVKVVLENWQQLFGKELSYHVENSKAFYGILDTAQLTLNYQLIELMQLLVDLYDNNAEALTANISQRAWKEKKQLAKTALIRSKHLLQFNMYYIFGRANWQEELQFFRSFGRKADTLRTQIQLLNDPSLEDQLLPILEITSNPSQGRRHYLTELNFQERSDWKDIVNLAIQRIEIRKTLYGKDVPTANLQQIKRLLQDLAFLLKSYNNFFDKPLERINAREIGLADNAAFLHELDNKGTIIWAHNLHVTKIQTNTRNDGDKMGTFLKQKYSDDILVFGTFFGSGTLQAWDYSGAKRKLSVPNVPLAKSGTLEDLFAKANCEICLLDLRNLPKDGIAYQWFKEQQEFRSIGNFYDANNPNDFYVKDVIPNHFDVLVFIKNTSRAEPTILSKQKYFKD